MTTVAAIARHGAVRMAADTMINLYDRPITGFPKICRLPIYGTGGELLLGFARHGGMGTLLRTRVDVPDEPAPDVDPQPWVDQLTLRITEVACRHGLVCNEQDGQMDAELLLGWRGRLWSIVHAAAIAHPEGVAAVGSGEGPAMGAMAALLAHTDLPPAEVLHRALMVACQFDRHTAPPIQVEALGVEL